MHRPSSAHLIAFLALFVSLSSGAYALAVPKNSIGAKQLKAGSVGASEIATGAVRSAEVKNGSLLKKDFKKGQLPTGAQGQTGARGPQGSTGAAGTARAYAYVRADGTLDTSRSKGVLAETHGVDALNGDSPVTGLYCFRLGFTPANVVATPDEADANAIAKASIPGPDVAAHIEHCPSTAPTAAVRTLEYQGTGPGFQESNDAFYVLFN